MCNIRLFSYFIYLVSLLLILTSCWIRLYKISEKYVERARRQCRIAREPTVQRVKTATHLTHQHTMMVFTIPLLGYLLETFVLRHETSHCSHFMEWRTYAAAKIQSFQNHKVYIDINYWYTLYAGSRRTHPNTPMLQALRAGCWVFQRHLLQANDYSLRPATWSRKSEIS